MITCPFFQVDAFTERAYGGNPAAVVLLSTWPSDRHLLAVAAENNLSETAFVVPAVKTDYELRWFTPAAEVDLCGHATLATAHVLFTERTHRKRVTFATRSGTLTVFQEAEHTYRMDFPLDKATPAPELQSPVQAILRASVLEVRRGKDDLLAVLDHSDHMRGLLPDLQGMKKLPGRGLIVTARGAECDFVSRCFYPKLAVPEDPVTGSAHTLLTAYWQDVLGKTQLRAEQWSGRGGSIGCQVQGNRVHLTGSAVTVIRGELTLPSY